MASVKMIGLNNSWDSSVCTIWLNFVTRWMQIACHLANIAAVLSRAWSAGVDRIIVTGGSLEKSKEALAIAETDARLFCTVGVHPTRCNLDQEFDESGDPKKHFQALL
ncbi:hypothetical protein R6Q59_011588 [Mikania micrantha]